MLIVYLRGSCAIWRSALPDGVVSRSQSTCPCTVFAPFPRKLNWPPTCNFVPVRPREHLLEITLQHAGGARFVAEARQHRILLDQPTEDDATDHGMTPAELLLASLGGNIGQYVAQYLRLRGLSAEGLLVRVQAQPSQRPLRLKDFQVEIIAPSLNERQLRALEKSFPAGIVQNTIALENTLRIAAVSARAEDVQP